MHTVNPFAAIATIVAVFLALVAVASYLGKAVIVYEHLRQARPHDPKLLAMCGALLWGVGWVSVKWADAKGTSL